MRNSSKERRKGKKELQKLTKAMLWKAQRKKKKRWHTTKLAKLNGAVLVCLLGWGKGGKQNPWGKRNCKSLPLEKPSNRSNLVVVSGETPVPPADSPDGRNPILSSCKSLRTMAANHLDNEPLFLTEWPRGPDITEQPKVKESESYPPQA